MNSGEALTDGAEGDPERTVDLKKIWKRDEKAMFDIRVISQYFREVLSRYYVDTTGSVYTSLGRNTHRIELDGERRGIKAWVQSNVSKLDAQMNLMMPLPNTGNAYFLLYDGTVLHRLKTKVEWPHSLPNSTDLRKRVVTVALLRVDSVNSQPSQYKVGRLVAGCFICDVEGKDVHHIDGDRTNNKLANLQVLPWSLHVEKHGKIVRATTIPQGSTPQAYGGGSARQPIGLMI